MCQFLLFFLRKNKERNRNYFVDKSKTMLYGTPRKGISSK